MRYKMTVFDIASFTGLFFPNNFLKVEKTVQFGTNYRKNREKVLRL